MQPVGGFTLLINLLIIILEGIKRKVSRFVRFKVKMKMPKYLPYLIIALSIMAASWGLVYFVNTSFRGDSGFYFLYGLYDKCESFRQQNSGRLAVIRIDDVQSYAWNEASVSMIEDSMGREVPLVLGVIPYRAEDDKLLLTSIKKSLCNIEIAQHGWSSDLTTHDTEVIEKQNESEIAKGLIEGKKVLERIAGGKIATFIPPTNTYTNKSLDALKDAGFLIVSSQGNTTYDYTTMTYDYESGIHYPISKIISDCENAFVKKKPCIIMTHPQDFVTGGKLDPKKYQLYLDMIDELRKRNVSFVRFNDIQN